MSWVIELLRVFLQSWKDYPNSLLFPVAGGLIFSVLAVGGAALTGCGASYGSGVDGAALSQKSSKSESSSASDTYFTSGQGFGCSYASVGSSKSSNESSSSALSSYSSCLLVSCFGDSSSLGRSTASTGSAKSSKSLSSSSPLSTLTLLSSLSTGSASGQSSSSYVG